MYRIQERRYSPNIIERKEKEKFVPHLAIFGSKQKADKEIKEIFKSLTK